MSSDESDVDEKAEAEGAEAADAATEEAAEDGTSFLDGYPTAVAELAAACVRFVTTTYGVPLDFTPDTLSLVDQYVRDARKGVADKPESLPLLQAAIGAYVGEVMRRALGGVWSAEGEHDAWRLQMTHVFLSFNPIGMAREALLLETAEGWHAHLEMDDAEREPVEGKLRSLPEVEEDEFYAPSTRFDVVELAVETLAAHMRSTGLGDVRFDRGDYETARKRKLN